MILKTKEEMCMLHKNYISLEHGRPYLQIPVVCILNGGEEFSSFESCEQIIFSDSIQIWTNHDI